MTLANRVSGLPAPVLLGLDVDGTLAPIVDDPMAARVPDPVLSSLRRLHDPPGRHVALLTGRDAEALSIVAPIHGIWRAVEHGRVRIDPGGAFHATALDPTAAAALDRFERDAAPLLERGARLERKPAARAIHTRGVDDGAAMLAEAEAIGVALGLHPRRGRSVLEVEVEPGDKGVALSAIAASVGAASTVFAGDDLTDAPALDAARELGGLAIFVRSAERSEAPTEVDAVVNGPAGLARLLTEIVR